MRWYFAVATGILVGIGFQVGTGQRVLPTGDESSALTFQGPLMISTCLFATLGVLDDRAETGIVAPGPGTAP